MDILAVERADHHGIVAGVIHDLGIIDLINDRLGIDSDEKVTAGESVAAMIINGLGFVDRPLSLTPQFFANCPLDLLFDKKICPDELNRFKLGRTLDRIFKYGCDTLFAEVSLSACKQEGVDTRFGHNDTTSYSLTGQYLPDSDEEAVRIVHGYSKDKRPDLKQVIQELMVSQDGNVPMLSKYWDGNTSDDEIFQKRTTALVEAFKNGGNPKVLVADSKLYNKENMPNLSQLSFITRVPDTINLVQDKMDEAISAGQWTVYDEKRKFCSYQLEHYSAQQTWIVINSAEARERAQITVERQCEKEYKAIKTQLFHLQAQRFSCSEDGMRDIAKKAKKWLYHELDGMRIEEHKIFSGLGRPKKDAVPDKIAYQLHIKVKECKEAKEAAIDRKSCFVLATNALGVDLTASEAIGAYIKQGSTVEPSFSFLKGPVFFTSSLFLKKPSRVEGLLTVMTLALLVYSIAQRRMRQALKESREMLPNQIKQPTSTPTLKWLFLLLDGISRVVMRVGEEIHYSWTGLSDLRRKILSQFGPRVMRIYQIAST